MNYLNKYENRYDDTKQNAVIYEVQVMEENKSNN